ncbi:MAG TPA: hypothetical protein VG755_22735 [Nannocystaceae bacterium]|nr:hypothetical protein [Nannocystaceae bacterium]
MTHARFSILLILAGCGTDEHATGNVVPRAVVPDAPAPDATNVDNATDIPAIGPLGFYSPGQVELSIGTDLAAATSFVQTSDTTWQQIATSKPHTIAPAFPDVLDAAADQAVADVVGANAGTLDGLLDALAASVPLPITVHFEPGSSTERWAGFPPLFARWITQDIDFATSNHVEGQAETVTDHHAPAMFDDSRLRGARLYCSARRAREEQGNGSPTMGQQTALEFALFDEPVRLLTVEPRVQLSNPQRIALAEDGLDVEGAQGFAIPMTLGTSFELASFLPALPELRTPVALVTADTEVETGAMRRPIAVGGVTCTINRAGYHCDPVTQVGYARTYQTATHVDAVAVGSYSRQTANGGLHMPLGRVGPMEMWLDGLAAIRLGQTSWADWSAANGPSIPVGAVDDRVLVNFKPPGAATRSGDRHTNPFGISYNDAPWELQTEAEHATDWYWSVESTSPWWIPLFGANSAIEMMRPQQNDDHAFAIGNEFHIEARAFVGVVDNFSAGPFSLSGPWISGGLAATLRQSFEFRDALHAQSYVTGGNPSIAATSVTVQPRTAALGSTTAIEAGMSLSLDLVFGEIDIDFSYPIVPSVDLGDWDSADDDAWGESSRLRMGTGGVTDFAHHTTRDAPLVASHLAGRSDYLPFMDQDVATCLAEPELTYDDSSLCDAPDLPEPELPTAEACLVFNPFIESELPPLSQDACTNIGQYAATQDPMVADCLQGMLTFACDPESEVQIYDGHWVVARVIEWDDTFFNELAARLLGCSEAWFTVFGSTDEQHLVDTLVGTAMCDDDGNILEGDDIFSSATNPYASPPVSGPAECR